MSRTLVGKVRLWDYAGTRIPYTVIDLDFAEASKLLKPDLYDASTNTGQQRQIYPPHARNIRKAMEAGSYTPTVVGVALRPEQQNRLNYEDRPDGRYAILDLSDDDTLLLIDGGHREDAITSLKDQDAAAHLPVTAMLYLEDDPRQLFLNLQKGRPVNKAHMLSLTVNMGAVDKKLGPALKLAMEAARLLATNKNSPFYNLITFDSRSSIGIPVSTLMAKGGSDIGTSLVGSAKIALSAGKDAAWIVDNIVKIYQAIQTKASGLLEVGRPLCPPPNGTRGGATMWIGLGNLLAYRLTMPTPYNDADDALESLVASAKEVADYGIRGNFSGPKKRELLGELAAEFFADVNSGDVAIANNVVPQGLVDTLSWSTFNFNKPRKLKAKAPAKKRGRPKKETTPLPEDVPDNPKVPEPEVEEETPDGAPVPWDNSEAVPWEEEVQA